MVNLLFRYKYKSTYLIGLKQQIQLFIGLIQKRILFKTKSAFLGTLIDNFFYQT